MTFSGSIVSVLTSFQLAIHSSGSSSSNTEVKVLALVFCGVHIRNFEGDPTEPPTRDVTMASAFAICESYCIADAKVLIQLDRRWRRCLRRSCSIVCIQ